MKYVIQLVPNTWQAYTHGVTWAGYWTGLGYVEDPKKALPFYRKQDALQAMHGNFLGMNGCMRVVALNQCHPR